MNGLLRVSFCAALVMMACNLGSPPAPAASEAPATVTQAAPAPTTAAGAQPIIIAGAGDIAAAVEQYRAALGADNGGSPGPVASGRREINWDGVPDELAAPNDYISDFFNGTQPPTARGIVLTSPGGVLRVSADSDNPSGTPARFADINPRYADIFKTFSPERLFSPVGSNVVDAIFFVPSTQVPALVRGFGAVYTDVDQAHTTFEYFDKDGNSLGKFPVPAADGGLSFLGVAFDEAIVAKVRIEYGTVALGPDDDAVNDVAVMDDFIFGEPQAIDPALLAVQPTPPASGFSLFTGPINRDLTQAAQSPALAVAGDTGHVWVAWAENASGGLRQIFVSEQNGQEFEPRGASLNLHLNVVADQPTITIAGENSSVPWVAWTEPSPGFGNVLQVFASRFNQDTGLWQPAGQDRGGAEPSLNLHTTRDATHPFIFGGSPDPASPPAPWVTWEELSGASNFVQIFVSRGVKDDAAIGGFRWEVVGQLRAHDEPSLNIDPARDGLHPVGVFAETGNAVPWITWHEIGADRPARVFTARGVEDAASPGGFKWINVPPCAPDETACSLNVNPLKDGVDAHMAAGSLVPGESSLPWIVWAEVGPTGKYQILVSRLDPATRNSFLNVGGSLNVDQNRDARKPFIAFIGHVPYVAWLEEDGTGKFSVQVRHLSSDPQTGTWAPDTPPGGFNFDRDFSDFGLAAAAGDALTMAWVEGDPAATAAQLVAGQLRP